MPRMPKWKVPKSIAKALKDNEGSWEEDERWSPIRLTAMSGTKLDGREIPVAWQVEFEPVDDEFEAGNARLEELGIEPDGCGWGDYILNALGQIKPALAQKVHLDCEGSTCVIWVESEDDCRSLIESVWKLVFEE